MELLVFIAFCILVSIGCAIYLMRVYKIPASNYEPMNIDPREPHFLLPPIHTPTSPEIDLQPEIKMPATEVLYLAAYKALGVDVTPDDVVKDEVACVVSLEAIIYRAFGFYVGGEVPIASTWDFFNAIKIDKRFKPVAEPKKGCILINVTGTGRDTIRGHCGVMGERWVMSNTSASGLWQANYTLQGWRKRFEGIGGMHTYCFEPL